jgi:GTP-binding protein HflX
VTGADRQGAGLTRAWVLHPDISSDPARRDPARALDEAVSLARALPGLEINGYEIVRLPKARAGLLFGSGKIEELGQKFKAHEIELVLIDGPVTPVQQRNLEREWKVKILDRTGLIIEIFSDRARTREGVLQVEMAALAYQRTRLVRAWTHLERQRGGLGFVGGPGETQIEADRRAIDDEIGRLKRQLAKVVKTRALHRAARARIPFPIGALVGYTNAGKSTFFNRLTGAEVLAKDMLFATLDPTMRAVRLPDGPEIILSDTVGFISALPTQLVAAFRATLEEVLSADLVVHVRDISHPETEEQAEDVAKILTDLGIDPSIPQIELWNKIDALEVDQASSARARAARQPNTICVSALTGEGFDAAIREIAALLQGEVLEEHLTLTHDMGRQRAWLYEKGLVRSEQAQEHGSLLHVVWNARQKAQFQAL